MKKILLFLCAVLCVYFIDGCATTPNQNKTTSQSTATEQVKAQGQNKQAAQGQENKQSAVSGQNQATGQNKALAKNTPPLQKKAVAQKKNKFSKKTTYCIKIISGLGRGKYDKFGGDNGPAEDAALYGPQAIVIDKDDNIYIADTYNNRVRMINKEGIITTIAGDGSDDYTVDSVPATSTGLGSPTGLALDSAGNLYISNGRVRKVDKNGIVTTIAGNSETGYSGDNGPATKALVESWGIACDKTGNLYIADGSNAAVRKVDKDGIITTIAGTGEPGYSGDDGPAIKAQLSSAVYGVAVDSKGNIYIADTGNMRVRKVDKKGRITTVAGNGAWGCGGYGGPAKNANLFNKFEIALDSEGCLYIADTMCQTIRKVDKKGLITTVAGTGKQQPGFDLDTHPALETGLDYPFGIAFDSRGYMYFTEQANDILRIACPCGQSAEPLAWNEDTTITAESDKYRVFIAHKVIKHAWISKKEQANNTITVTDKENNKSRDIVYQVMGDYYRISGVTITGDVLKLEEKLVFKKDMEQEVSSNSTFKLDEETTDDKDARLEEWRDGWLEGIRLER